MIEHVDPIAHTGAALPDDREGLLAECDRTSVDGPGGPDLVRSLLAAQRLLEMTPKDGDAAWRAARAVWLIGLSATATDAGSLSERCLHYGALATANSTTAQAPFYAALCMGARAQVEHMEGLELIKQMVAAGTTAVDRDPAVQHGGPHRLLGGIYLWAPSWPTSVGDPEEAISELEKAVSIDPGWPENHLLLAQAYFSDDRVGDAKAALVRMRATWDAPHAAGWHGIWQTHLDKLEKKIAEQE